MSRVVAIAIWAAVIAAAVVFVLQLPHNRIFGLPDIQSLLSGKQVSSPEELESIENPVATPEPLRGSTETPGGHLTGEGVLRETNRHRHTSGVAALTAHATLNQAAQAKLSDMFAKQYFDHVSPDGKGPADVVSSVGYTYLRVGENLALGNFEDDIELVQAWMDSPGHRANILSPSFHEIGIAVGQGELEGNQTWLAVQTFGLPASVCPTPDPAQHSSFEEQQTHAQTIKAELESTAPTLEEQTSAITILSDEVTSLAQQGQTKVEEGNAKIEEGNTIYQHTGSASQAQPYWDEGAALQAEGQALLDEARGKQEALEQDTAEYNELSQKYNKDVDEYNQLQEELSGLVDNINTQITAYNECIEAYQ